MRYHQFLRNTLYLRYILFFVTIYVGILMVRAYMSQQDMTTHISTIQQELSDVEEKTAFIKQFEKPFLDSDRAPFYLGHENGVLYAGERVVRLRTRAPIKKDDSVPDEILAIQQSTDDKIKIASPEESRHYFINDKLEPLKDLGIIR